MKPTCIRKTNIAQKTHQIRSSGAAISVAGLICDIRICCSSGIAHLLSHPTGCLTVRLRRATDIPGRAMWRQGPFEESYSDLSFFPLEILERYQCVWEGVSTGYA
jgi:hypothetical protein